MRLHEMQGKHCPTAPDIDMSCEPEPAIDPDFASLLEREPRDGGRPQAMDAAGAASDYVAVISARRERDLAKKTADSQAARIKELEGVLVEVRAKLAHAKVATRGTDSMLTRMWKAIDDVAPLINETLDPCKPWCVLEPGHGGACSSGDWWDGTNE